MPRRKRKIIEKLPPAEIAGLESLLFRLDQFYKHPDLHLILAVVHTANQKRKLRPLAQLLRAALDLG